MYVCLYWTLHMWREILMWFSRPNSQFVCDNNGDTSRDLIWKLMSKNGLRRVESAHEEILKSEAGSPQAASPGFGKD